MLSNFKTHAAAAQSRFPCQHGPEVPPTGIENALCHVGTSEFRGANIAKPSEPKLPHKLRRLLVEKIFSAISEQVPIFALRTMTAIPQKLALETGTCIRAQFTGEPPERAELFGQGQLDARDPRDSDLVRQHRQQS